MRASTGPTRVARMDPQAARRLSHPVTTEPTPPHPVPCAAPGTDVSRSIRTPAWPKGGDPGRDHPGAATAYATSQPAMSVADGMRPTLTTLPSMTSPGVDMTPWARISA